MKKLLLIFGTRPEAIKMSPLVKELEKHSDQFNVKVCVTAQHREMLDQVLTLFEIVPDYDLNIMKTGQDLYDITTCVLIGLRDVLKEVQPDMVLVHGDTSTSTAAALAAFYQQIPVGHIEAGLRTYDIYSPWPEEMNRQLTGRLSTLHFAPTYLSKQNLLNEGIKKENIHVTGNTVIDALYWVIRKMNNTPEIEQQVLSQLEDEGLSVDLCNSWIKKERKIILITGHRRENFGQGFVNICEAIKDLSISFLDFDFVYPMHLNPNVRNPIAKVFGTNLISYKKQKSSQLFLTNYGKTKWNNNVYFIEPLNYLPFVYLMNLSYIVLTDSGGIQEEAPGLGKPVLVMRNTTERPEALDAGTVKLVGTDKQKIIYEVTMLINDEKHYQSMARATNPYGDGKACIRIIKELN